MFESIGIFAGGIEQVTKWNMHVKKKKIYIYIYCEFKGACSDPQPHPPKFFQTYGDFGTRI